MPKKEKITGFSIIQDWLSAQKKAPFAFQVDTWNSINKGLSGLVNAPTGSGKTYSVFLGALIQFIEEYGADYISKKNNGLRLLWITPLRALAKDIARAMEEAITQLGMQW